MRSVTPNGKTSSQVPGIIQLGFGILKVDNSLLVSGHTEVSCSCYTQWKNIISGSWDNTIRVWILQADNSLLA
ncbi:MAG: hypothetical protein H7A36_03275 [Chlamydiales bacterium]|nr:hypothetical protein [Chlamydiales bacterium]